MYGAVRFWIMVTRPVNIKDVPTPTVDRLNTHALDHMAGKTEEEAAAALQESREEAPPQDLLDAIPPEQRLDRPNVAKPEK